MNWFTFCQIIGPPLSGYDSRKVTKELFFYFRGSSIETQPVNCVVSSNRCLCNNKPVSHFFNVEQQDRSQEVFSVDASEISKRARRFPETEVRIPHENKTKFQIQAEFRTKKSTKQNRVLISMNYFLRRRNLKRKLLTNLVWLRQPKRELCTVYCLEKEDIFHIFCIICFRLLPLRSPEIELLNHRLLFRVRQLVF